MKTITFLKSSIIAVCFLSLNLTSSFAQVIAEPGGLEWLVMDTETEGKIPYVNGGPDGDFIFKTSPWASQSTSIVNNPNKTGFFNDSEKCFLWVKENVSHGDWSEGDWGSVGIELTNANAYWNLSRWDQVSVEVLVEDYPINMYKIGLCLAENTEFGGVEFYDVNNKPSDEWNRLSISLDELKNGNKELVKVTPDTKITQFKIYINGGAKEKMNIYVDNLRFSRASEPTGLSDVGITEINVFPNPTTESIKISETKGLVQIYNLQGAEIITITDYNGEEISVSALSSGMYLVKTNNKTLKFTKK